MSQIHKESLERIAESPFGPALVEAFKQLAEGIEAQNSVDTFVQVGFTHPGDPLLEGDLIPSIHLSLRPAFQPIMSQPAEVIVKEEE